MKRLFLAVFGIRPDELLLVQAFFALFTAVGVAATLGLTAADTLFLSRFRAAEAEKLLPATYAGIGFVGVAVAALYEQVAARMPRMALVIGTPLVLAASLLAFRQALLLEAKPLYFALVIWIEICGLLAASVVFAHASDTFSGRDAKRLYGYITGGLAMGTIVSGYAVDPLVERLGAEGLLLATAAALVAAAAIAGWTFRLRGRRPPEPETETDAGGVPLSALLRNRHVVLTFAFGLGGLICAVLGDYQLKIVASRSMDEAQLAAFFGRFYAYLGVAQLLVQFLLVGWLLRRFGLLGGVLVMPLLMLGGSVGFVLWPVVLVAAGGEFVRQCFADTMEGPSRELLFLPLPARLRVRAQTLASGALDAGGQAVAGLMVFAAMLVLPHVRWLGVVTFAVAAAWLLAAKALRPHYERTLIGSLEAETFSAGDLAPLLDSPEAPRVLRAMLVQGGGRAEMALELLGIRRGGGECLVGLVDPVAALVDSPRAALAVAALERLGESSLDDTLPPIRRALGDARAPVRAAAIRALASRVGNESTAELEAALVDEDARVVESALIAALRHGDESARDAAQRMIERLRSEADAGSRSLAARALGGAATAGGTVLAALLADDDAVVVAEALRAAQRVAAVELLPQLCERLAEVRHRRAAAAAIAALPRAAVPDIVARVRVGDRPEAERIALASALGEIGGPAAASALMDLVEPHHFLLLRLQAARALWRLPSGREVVEAATLDRRIDEILARLELVLRAAAECASGRPHRSVLFVDHARLHSSLLFALLGLRHGGAESLCRAESHLFSPDPRLQSNALELVDAVLPRAISARVLPLLMNLTGPPAVPGADLAPRTRAELAASGSPWLEALASSPEGAAV